MLRGGGVQIKTYSVGREVIGYFLEPHIESQMHMVKNVIG